MSIVCPTITAYDIHEYRVQMELISKFASRIHVDLMDGVFAPTKSPPIDQLWLREKVVCDVHIMYQHPFHWLRQILALNPSLVIVQAEADKTSVQKSIAGIRQTRVRVGVSLLASTDPDEEFAAECIKNSSYVLIFSGHLGYHGGAADLELIDKIAKIKAINPTVEIGWDGGINAENVALLARAGIDVLNVGGAVHKAVDPGAAYARLVALATTDV
jgi:ribulose-phosphate 3-epimerase